MTLSNYFEVGEQWYTHQTHLLEVVKEELLLRGSGRKINTYSYHIRSFLQWLQKPLDFATEDDMRNYWIYLSHKDSSTAEVAIDAIAFLYRHVLHKPAPLQRKMQNLH